MDQELICKKQYPDLVRVKGRFMVGHGQVERLGCAIMEALRGGLIRNARRAVKHSVNPYKPTSRGIWDWVTTGTAPRLESVKYVTTTAKVKVLCTDEKWHYMYLSKSVYSNSKDKRAPPHAFHIYAWLKDGHTPLSLDWTSV